MSGSRIAVVGAGANGAGIGADLVRAGFDVDFSEQWPAHVEAIRRNGVRVVTPAETRVTPVHVRMPARRCAVEMDAAGRPGRGLEIPDEGPQGEGDAISGLVAREFRRPGGIAPINKSLIGIAAPNRARGTGRRADLSRSLLKA
jgi:hypothetical protein